MHQTHVDKHLWICSKFSLWQLCVWTLCFMNSCWRLWLLCVGRMAGGSGRAIQLCCQSHGVCPDAHMQRNRDQRIMGAYNCSLHRYHGPIPLGGLQLASRRQHAAWNQCGILHAMLNTDSTSANASPRVLHFLDNVGMAMSYLAFCAMSLKEHSSKPLQNADVTFESFKQFPHTVIAEQPLHFMLEYAFTQFHVSCGSMHGCVVIFAGKPLQES